MKEHSKDELRAYIKANDQQYEEITITEVSSDSIKRSDGWSFGKPKNVPVEPGMTVRFYGEGFGRPVRGLDVLVEGEWREDFYRTPAEESVNHERMCAGFAIDEAKRNEECRLSQSPEKEQLTVNPGMEAEWKEAVDKNRDAYGYGVVLATVAVGKELDAGKSPEEANKASYGLGISGFMAGCMASWINHFHPRGDEFRSFWNKDCGAPESEGVANPALLTIGTTKDA